jgi:1-acyl-sn-glycerol-3-phosphate acyltransferase
MVSSDPAFSHRPDPQELLDSVLEVVRGLAREVGGRRAERAVAPEASLDREVGLGSLERVELLARLERALGRSLEDRCLQIDTAAGLARALLEAAPERPLVVPSRDEKMPGAATGIGSGVRTLQESLWRHARLDPERTHVLLSGDDGEVPVSYGRLQREAQALAAGLRERGLGQGDSVSLMLPTGLDFLRSFLGILMARAVPVPIYPPVRLDRLEDYATRQAGILADASARLLVTVSRARPVARLLRPAVPSLDDVVTADELAIPGAAPTEPEGEGSDPAFIQYTSGSTGQPKGVLLTHDNLLANIRAITEGLEATPADVGVSWLPLYHDMGLIGSWLFCLHAGLPLTLLSPTTFLARPERWLWAIHQRRATLSGAPNFAYELCVRRVPDEALEGLDLSSWRAAMNGAEPVSPGTVERFTRRFARYGFRAEALMPAYGLAENSVALTLPPMGQGTRFDRVARVPFQREGRAVPAEAGDTSALHFVNAGRALPGHEIRVVDDQGRDVEERVVGRLVFRGPSMTSGYYRQPDATAAISLPGGWLDSGDLAYRANGDVHIAGRRKDLIIKGGRNIVPQEVEEAAAEEVGIRRGCVVAFGADHPELGTEGLVVVAETRVSDPAERCRLESAVTERVAAAIDVPPDRVVLVPPGAVLKTSSGKVRRAATRERYLSGALGRPPRTTATQRIRLLTAAGAEALRPWVQRASRGLYAVYLALALPLVVLPVWAIVALVPSRRLAFALGRVGSRVGLTLMGCRLSVEGLRHLPREGAAVLACNHASYTDVFVLIALLPRDLVFVAKKEVLGYPVIRTFVRRLGYPTVDRLDFQKGLADSRRVGEALERGAAVVFFPEGTFVAATGLRPFRLGAFKAAADAGAPVLPLALRGTRQLLRGNDRLPRPRPLHLFVGPALAPEGSDLAALVAFRDRVAEEIAGQCGEPRLDVVAAGVERREARL